MLKDMELFLLQLKMQLSSNSYHLFIIKEEKLIQINNKLIIKLDMKMNKFFYQSRMLLFLILFKSFLISNTLKCTICLSKIELEYSIDVWGNAFHSHHESEGLFCHSCSRIISKKITNGGYIYSDGRQLCSLCQASAIQNESESYKALNDVILQLFDVGIDINPENISISIVNLNQLNKHIGILTDNKLKGYTQTHKNSKSIFKYEIFLLNGLPELEFKATLAHELLHVWLNDNSIILNNKIEEGFCNLGNYLIYTKSNTKYAKIHLTSMENNNDEIYGDGYRYMKDLLIKHGWSQIIIMLSSL